MIPLPHKVVVPGVWIWTLTNWCLLTIVIVALHIFKYLEGSVYIMEMLF